jgi:formyltetrahydrofolate hydrolase
MYTGFCILSILWKQKQENIDVHVYWVLYSQYSLETERRKHRCTCILGSVLSVFSGNRKKKTKMYMYTGFCILNILWKQKEENIDVHVYWVLYSQYSLKHKEENIDVHVYWVLYSQHFQEAERRKHRCKSILSSVFSVFSGNRKKKT